MTTYHSEGHDVTVRPVGIHPIYGKRCFCYVVTQHWIKHGLRDTVLWIDVEKGDHYWEEVVRDKYPDARVFYQFSLPFELDDIDEFAWF